jgi:hypothetical protein
MKLSLLYFTILLTAAGFLFFSAFQFNKIEEEQTSNENLIKFSHSLHKDLADCQTCHSAVVSSTSLKDRLFPNHDNCADCHAVDDENECKTCHYDELYEPLIQKETELFFNHSFHLSEQALVCESCHKGIGEVDYAEDAFQPNPIMEDCYSCHKDIAVASNACETCHVSTTPLIPQTHKNVSFLQTHKFSASAFDANCIMCHDNNNNSCQECHIATNVITETNVPDNFYQPYAPNLLSDGAKKQQITRVHELNYRFTHGIDLKGKTSECQSCHEVETFCASCHQSEESDFALGGILPASHLKSGFFTLGVGSGGGDHAILAKRDIERCTSCHDIQGADPTCITCHLDSDGIKGTNPKTHAIGFMSDMKGDWHDSEGSICYNCHNGSPSTPSGIGFCGYCHGAEE